MTIPAEVTAAINQLLANQAAIMQQKAEIHSAPNHHSQRWHSTYPPSKMCQSLPSRHFQVASSTWARATCMAVVDVREPVPEDAVDAGATDTISLPTTWLILTVGWDSSCNTVEASLGKHYLEICLLHSRACNVVECHIPTSTIVTITRRFFCVALTWKMATLPSHALSEK
jgi:hypothetical protein